MLQVDVPYLLEMMYHEVVGQAFIDVLLYMSHMFISISPDLTPHQSRIAALLPYFQGLQGHDVDGGGGGCASMKPFDIPSRGQIRS